MFALTHFCLTVYRHYREAIQQLLPHDSAISLASRDHELSCNLVNDYRYSKASVQIKLVFQVASGNHSIEVAPFLDSVPVGVRLKLRSVANALAPKLVIKVDSLPEVYTAKARFSSEKSGQNIVYWVCE